MTYRIVRSHEKPSARPAWNCVAEMDCTAPRTISATFALPQNVSPMAAARKVLMSIPMAGSAKKMKKRVMMIGSPRHSSTYARRARRTARDGKVNRAPMTVPSRTLAITDSTASSRVTTKPCAMYRMTGSIQGSISPPPLGLSASRSPRWPARATRPRRGR